VTERERREEKKNGRCRTGRDREVESKEKEITTALSN